MGVSMLSLVRRIPKAIGPLLGGVFIAAWGERDGVRLAFVAAFAMALVALVLQWRFIEPDAPAEQVAPAHHPWRLMRRMNPALRRLLVSDILVRFCEQIPFAFVVVWCMKVIANPVSAVQFGLLTTIEMVVAILIYIPVAHLADQGEKKRYVLITFVFFTMFPLVLLFSRSFGWLVAAFALRGLKEFGEPTRKSLIMDLSPESNRAGMFGLYYLVRDIVVSVAALGGAFLWRVSPELNLLSAFAFGVLGTLWFAIFGRDVQRIPAH
jgi:MFS family permease